MAGDDSDNSNDNKKGDIIIVDKDDSDVGDQKDKHTQVPCSPLYILLLL